MDLDIAKKIISQNKLHLFKEFIEGKVFEELNLKNSKCFLSEEIPYKDYKINIGKCDFNWSEFETIEEIENLKFDYKITLNLNIHTNLEYEDLNSKESFYKIKYFNLKCYYFPSLTTDNFSYKLLSEKEQLLEKYNEEILIIYRKEKILDIEPNNGLKIEGKNYLLFFTDIVNKPRSNKVKINSFNFFDDLLKKTIDIKFLLANMYMHKPFLWNFLKHNYKYNNKNNFYYYMSYNDTRYMTYCDLLFQTIYNYWDKIGDLLAMFFTPKLSNKNLYFGNVIKNIPTLYKVSENYVWLNEFRENDYLCLNKKRILTVHYNNYSSGFYEHWLKNISNEDEIEKLQKDINDLTDYFKDNLNKAITGFEKALKLIDEIE